MSGRCCYLGSSIFSAKLPINIPIKQNQKFVSQGDFFLSIGTIITFKNGTVFRTVSWNIFEILYVSAFFKILI